jgi:hypothetical protein
MLFKIASFCTTHKSSVSTCFAEQIMPILHILCCNGCLATWTVVSLATSKFKRPIFSMSGFTLFYAANMFILIISYDFCFFTWIVPTLTVICIAFGIHEKCRFLVRIHGNFCWFSLTRKTRSVPSRSSRICISIETYVNFVATPRFL